MFISGGICIGKTTVIQKLISDEEINPKQSERAHAVIEPTEYWYKNESRQMDDTLLYFVLKDLNDNEETRSFPFSEFFISTWLLNIMISIIKASLERKSLILIERDYSDEYLLQRQPFELFNDSFQCFRCMKKKFGAYVLLRFQTKRPLIQVMRQNLIQRQTSELDLLENKDYNEFIDKYEVGCKAIGAFYSSQAADTNLVAREYFIERYVSETFDEIKLLILNNLK